MRLNISLTLPDDKSKIDTVRDIYEKQNDNRLSYAEVVRKALEEIIRTTSK